MSARIVAQDATELAPLYDRYRGQSEPQPAHLEINTETGVAVFETSGEIGNGVPMRVWHGIDRRVSCSCYLTGAQLVAASAYLLPLVQTVYDETDTDWDGSNMVGTITDAGQEALDEIEQYLDGIDGEVQVRDAGEWHADAAREHLTAAATDAEIAALAAEWESDALAEGIFLEGDLVDYLTEVRDELAADAADAEAA